MIAGDGRPGGVIQAGGFRALRSLREICAEPRFVSDACFRPKLVEYESLRGRKALDCQQGYVSMFRKHPCDSGQREYRDQSDTKQPDHTFHFKSSVVLAAASREEDLDEACSEIEILRAVH